MSPRNANELVSSPVVSTREGRAVGRVKDVLFDPDTHQLIGFMVTMTTITEPTTFLPSSAVRGIGDDAVTVESEASLASVGSFTRAREIIDSGIHLKGATVLTEDGDAIGKISKILLNDDQTVAAYEVSRGFFGLARRLRIPPSDILSIGQDAIIVSRLYHDGQREEEEAEVEHPGGEQAAPTAALTASEAEGVVRPTSPAQAPRAAANKPVTGEVGTTRQHDVIQAWAEQRAGHPAAVRGSDVLRIAFGKDDRRLQPITWAAFFDRFDASGCDFRYGVDPDSTFYAFTSD